MKIFISWSGERSKYVAALLREWLKAVLQASKPWMSDSDINKGSIWFNDVSGELKDVAVGIVCLTPENKDKPWILFEAGALLRGLTNSCVCTVLIDLEPADVESPLSHFNHTRLDKEGLFALLGTLNSQLKEGRLEKETLKSSFDAFWPMLEQGLSKMPKIKGEKSVKRDSGEILEEILEISREVLAQQNRSKSSAANTFINSYMPASPSLSLLGTGTGSALTPEQVRTIFRINLDEAPKINLGETPLNLNATMQPSPTVLSPAPEHSPKVK